MNLPLTWVAPKNLPVSFVGTVWNGAVTDIPNFAPVKTNVSPLKAVTGKPPVSFTTEMPGLQANGTVSLGGKVNLKTTGNMTFVARVDGRLSGLMGDYSLTLQDILIKTSCISGTGQVDTDVLTRNEVRWQWRGPELSGPVSCQNGDVKLTLSGQDRDQTVSVEIRLSLKGTYIIKAEVETRDQRAGLFLPLYGFQQSDTGYRLNEQGRWM